MGSKGVGYWSSTPAGATVPDTKAGKPDGSGYTAREMDKMGEPDVTPQLTQTGTPFDQYGGKPPLVLSPESLPPLPTTDFDTYRLNDMVDMVEDSMPQQLEDVGDALWTAASELKKAGSELKKHLGDVEWSGIAASAFRDWGADLGSSTLRFGDYVATVGTQLKAAGVGLAMVKSSVTPLRYDGPGLTIQDIPAPARVKGNGSMKNLESKELKEENAKAEANRKEAVIQMNKLSSYYTVSRDNMKSAEMPPFPPMPKVGVPKPKDFHFGGAPEQPNVPGGAARNTVADAVQGPVSGSVPGHRTDGIDSSGGSGAGELARLHDRPDLGPPREAGAIADVPVGTDINSTAPPVTSPHGGGSAAAPPAPTTTAGPMGQPPIGGPGMPPTAMMPPPGKVGDGSTFRSPRPPVQGGLGRPGPMTPGQTGRQGPMIPGQQGPGQAGPGGRPAGRPTGPGGMGRPGMMGPGMMGQGGAGEVGSGPASGGARAARPGGIVGGTPVRSAPGASGPRIPRGTVVGGEGTSGRGPLGMAPTGGTGGGGGGGQSGSSGRVASSSGGVVGSPRSGASGPGRGGPREFTPGGSGLVRKGQGGGAVPSGGVPKGRRRSRDEPGRPDYLTEDEETWSTGRRSAAPPVIE